MVERERHGTIGDFVDDDKSVEEVNRALNLHYGLEAAAIMNAFGIPEAEAIRIILDEQRDTEAD